MTRDTAERARECHYELFRWDGPHYCHLPPEHEGGHEWFYTRKQVTQIQAEARERLAAWMIKHSFSTGHGDTFEDLLKELDWQVKELRGARLEEAKLWAHNWYGGYDNLGLSGKALESHREQCRDCLRIAALAQALQPEEKEGT